jgi:hypothetical protein
MMHDIEVLVLRLLPRYLRALTRQEGRSLLGREAAHGEGHNVVCLAILKTEFHMRFDQMKSPAAAKDAALGRAGKHVL